MNLLIISILFVISKQQSEDDVLSTKDSFKNNPLIKLLGPLLDQLRLKKLENDTLEIDTEQIKKELKQYQNNTLKKWNVGMIDFIPDDIVSFDLANQEVLVVVIEILFEEVKQATVLRGAFFISDYQKQKIKLVIRSPSNITIFEKESDSDTFYLPLEEVGEYKFIFTNKKSENIQVTFAIDIHDSHNDIMMFQDLDPINQKLEAIRISMRDKYFYAKLFQQRYYESLANIESSNKKLLLFSSIEVVGTVVITLWQVWYIRRVLSTEKLI